MLTVVIPMAGEGTRFKQIYSLPKPLIAIRNKPMIQWVIRSLGMPTANYVMICRNEEVEKYHLRQMFKAMLPEAASVNVVTVNKLTDGAACTVLCGLELVDENSPILISNADQYMQWDPLKFLRLAESGVDGVIPVFNSVHPKWSYIEVDHYVNGIVRRVAEKEPISQWATCGLYYYRQAKLFKDAAQKMIAADKRVNGEFYVAPVYNELIANGGKVISYRDLEFYGLGTPEDLEEFRYYICANGRS